MQKHCLDKIIVSLGLRHYVMCTGGNEGNEKSKGKPSEQGES